MISYRIFNFAQNPLFEIPNDGKSPAYSGNQCARSLNITVKSTECSIGRFASQWRSRRCPGVINDSR